MLPSNTLQQVRPIHLWHAHVRHDDVHRFPFEEIQCLQWPVYEDQLPLRTLAPQPVPKPIQDVWLVIDEEQTLHSHDRLLCGSQIRFDRCQDAEHRARRHCRRMRTATLRMSAPLLWNGVKHERPTLSKGNGSPKRILSHTPAGSDACRRPGHTVNLAWDSPTP